MPATTMVTAMTRRMRVKVTGMLPVIVMVATSFPCFASAGPVVSLS